MLYLDYVATTPLKKEVKDTYFQILEEHFANADSIHHLGLVVEGLMERSRSLIASLLKVKSGELIFTGGASESNNLAIKGVAFKYKKRGNHLITTMVEHSSVYETFKQLEDEFGFDVTYLKVDALGSISLDELKQSLREDTILVSIMAVNNEVGMVYPIDKIAKIVKENSKAYVHIDMVQALGKINIDLKDVDLASFSAHKIYGLKGSGLLFKRDQVQLLPIISGGQQEFGLRAGTSNAPTNIVLAKTIRLALENLDENYKYVSRLNAKLRYYFNSLDRVVMNSPINATPYILNVSLLDYKPEVLINALEKYEIYFSTKSACSTKKNTISRTLKAMNVSDEVGNSALRISLSNLVTLNDLDYFINSFNKVLNEVRKR